MTETPPPDRPEPDAATSQTPPQSPPPPPPGDGADPGHGQRPPLLRSRDDRVLGGVCAGLARTLGVDPVIVRIAAVVLTFVSGLGVVAYLAGLVLIPRDDGSGHPAGPPPAAGRAGAIAGGALLVIIAIAVIDGPHGFGGPWWFTGPLLPLAIIGVLGVVAYRLAQGDGAGAGRAARVAGAILLVVAGLAAAGVAFIATAWATAAGAGAIVAGAVIAIGLAIVAFAVAGRQVRWLAAVALVLATPVGVVAAADMDADGGVGQRTYRPLTVADIPAGGYKLGIGRVEVDLRDLRWPRDEPVRLSIDVGIGDAVLLVPRETCVEGRAGAGLGHVDVLGDDAGGPGADIDVRPGSAPGHRQRLVLDARIGLGAVHVAHHHKHDGPPWLDDGRRPPWGDGRPVLERNACEDGG